MSQPMVFNPFQPGFTDDPYPHLAELRAADPVQEHPMGFWILSRYEDVHALMHSSLSADDTNLAPGPVRQMREAITADERWRTGGLSMVDRDPPDHTRIRRLVAKAFTPRNIAALEPRIEDMVSQALDAIADAGRTDLVSQYAFPLPFTVISEMLGMPEVEHKRLRDLSGVLVRSMEPVVDEELTTAIVEADDELAGMVGEIITWKRENPADDLLTLLIEASQDGSTLTERELVSQVIWLYVAGHETTVNLIANGVIALLHNPDQLELLRERPELTENAVEELCRYDSPVQLGRRITLEPYVVGGHEIPPGSFVIGSFGAANRDEKRWGDSADQLLIERPDARHHVSFGAGVHHCLGAALARMEARIAIGRLVRRFPKLSLDGEVRWNGRINLRGPDLLPVRV